eukprot:3264166-Lingulodinium_polyedra.AAC.1
MSLLIAAWLDSLLDSMLNSLIDSLTAAIVDALLDSLLELADATPALPLLRTFNFQSFDGPIGRVASRRIAALLG